MNCDIGIIGLAVMGENLALCFEERGYSVAVFNRNASVVDRFIADRALDRRIRGCHSLEEFVQSLAPPRKVLLVIKSGPPVDECLHELVPLFTPGDVVADLSNSHFTDTERRIDMLEAQGMYFLGGGLAGGEEGALRGACFMLGGSAQGWQLLGPILSSGAARVGESPCCAWFGERAQGSVIKCVHNALQTGIMQLVCEAYWLLRCVAGISSEEISCIFQRWNGGRLESYVLEAAADILQVKDYLEPDTALVENLSDAFVRSRGAVGGWAVDAAFHHGAAATVTAEALFFRAVSSSEARRLCANKALPGPVIKREQCPDTFIEQVEHALYAGMLTAYAQSFHLISAMRGAGSRIAQVAHIWQGALLVRAALLREIEAVYRSEPGLAHLFLAQPFTDAIGRSQEGLRTVVCTASELGIPAPCFSSALAYYDGLRSSRLPGNLLAAMRDYSGAHAYARKDQPGQTYHSDWRALLRSQG